MSTETFPPAPLAFDLSMTTTALELPGYRILVNHGVVRGIVVRSRDIFATTGAKLQTLLGGDITVFTKLCEKTRQDSFAMMVLHASQLGANAVIAVHYDTTEVMPGVSEVLAYGTAVFVEKV